MTSEQQSQTYIIRNSGERCQEKIVSGGVFAWLYNHPDGIKFRPRLMENRLLHCLVEKFASNSLSRHLIDNFARKAGIDISEAEKPLHRFKSLNDFFTRKLKKSARTINYSNDVFIAPGDGKLLVFDKISPGSVLPIKGLQVSLKSLLQDSRTAQTFSEGSAMVLRLYLMDYHRIHFPCDGIPHQPVNIKGHYYSVSPVKGNNLDFYSMNKRTCTGFSSKDYGEMAFLDIGGFLIASIKHLFEPELLAKKGAEKSLFQFGGSTLVVLFQKNRIIFDQDLVENSKAGVETYVKLGERIGRPFSA
ncbi:MAG: phosphatidylserine decarboxylase [Candidatus Rifleibacteriota bacterium]